MPSTFEVFFVASVPALGVSHYTLMYGSDGSATAVVQYINHQLSRYKIYFVHAKLYIIIMHIINPRRMREGYCSRSVCVSVCPSVNSVTATCLVCESQPRCCMIPYDVSKPCIVWISLKTLCSPVLATFAQDRYLPPSFHAPWQLFHGQNEQQ